MRFNSVNRSTLVRDFAPTATTTTAIIKSKDLKRSRRRKLKMNLCLNIAGGILEFQSRFGNLCASQRPQTDHPLYSPTTPVFEPEVETAVASQVYPFLFLGNARDAACLDRLRELGITHVLNVTSHLPHYHEQTGLVYERLSATDDGCQDLSKLFNQAFSFINAARCAGGRVLVHCQAGVSRSSTITIAYLMKHTRLNFTDAYRAVKQARPIIAPNFNFMGQLMEFDQALSQGRIARCPLDLPDVTRSAQQPSDVTAE